MELDNPHNRNKIEEFISVQQLPPSKLIQLISFEGDDVDTLFNQWMSKNYLTTTILYMKKTRIFQNDKYQWSLQIVYDKKIIEEESSKVLEENPRVLLWDSGFNGECYTYSKDLKTIYYASGEFPTARIKGFFSDWFCVKMWARDYFWFGVGSRIVRPNVFPGHTKEGWVLCTDGRLFHNNKLHESLGFIIGKGEITFYCQPRTGEIDVIVNNVSYKHKISNLPKEVCFIASLSSGSLQLIDDRKPNQN